MNYNPTSLIGLVLPPIIDLINKDVQNSKLSYLLSLLVCIIAGVVLNLDKINDWKSLLANITVVIVSAQLMFQLYYQKSSLRADITGDPKVK